MLAAFRSRSLSRLSLSTLRSFRILLKDIQVSTNANKYNHSIIVTQSVLTYHVVSRKLPLIIRLIVRILHRKFNGHHTIRIMQQYVWTRLIRIECKYREFDFNANHNSNSCGQALSKYLTTNYGKQFSQSQGRFIPVYSRTTSLRVNSSS